MSLSYIKIDQIISGRNQTQREVQWHFTFHKHRPICLQLKQLMEFSGTENWPPFLKLYHLTMPSSKTLGIKAAMSLQVTLSRSAAVIPIVLETPASLQTP